MSHNYHINTELHFGRNILREIGGHCARYGDSALILCRDSASMRPLAAIVKESLQTAGLRVSVFERIQPNPQSRDVDLALAMLQEERPASLVAIGGGSTMDSAKALALRFACLESAPDWRALFQKYRDFTSLQQDLLAPIPIVAVPTTAGTGSHVTQAMVITHEGQKQTFFHHQVKPVLSFLDSIVYEQAPLEVKRVTSFDAFAHAFESYLSPAATVFSRAFSLQALHTILPLLPTLDSEQTEPHTQAIALMQADTLAGQGLACVGAGLPHPLGELLSAFVPGLVHGRSLAIFYPAYLQFLQRSSPHTVDALASDLGYRNAEELVAEILSCIEQIGLRQNIHSLLAEESNSTKAEIRKIMAQISYQDIPISQVEQVIEEA